MARTTMKKQIAAVISLQIRNAIWTMSNTSHVNDMATKAGGGGGGGGGARSAHAPSAMVVAIVQRVHERMVY